MPPGQTLPSIQSEEEIVQPKTLYAFDDASGTWLPGELERAQDATPDLNPTSNPTTDPTSNLPTFTLITYNIDAMNYYVHERLNTLLSFLHTHTILPLHNATPPIPTIILLQELSNDALPTLLAHPIVREGFCVTDVDTEDWEASYGTITLVPRSWAVEGARRVKVWRTPFVGSRMGRSALYVDVDLAFSEQREGAEGVERKLLRIANVHLESLRGRSDALRIEQLTSVARRLHEPGVYAGVVAGDMNPIGPYDDAAPASLGLTDAWLSCQEMSVAGTYTGKPKSTTKEGDGWKGITWGQQPPSQFPERRMDKILLVGNVQPREVEVVGKGLVAEGIQLDDIDLEIMEDLEGMEEDEVWVSDHYGVVARIEVV